MSVQNVFSPRASRVVCVFLVNPKQEWSILGLSKEAQTGYGHTYRVVKTLLRMGLCRKTERNRVVVTNSGETEERTFEISYHYVEQKYYMKTYKTKTRGDGFKETYTDFKLFDSLKECFDYIEKIYGVKTIRKS